VAVSSRGGWRRDRSSDRSGRRRPGAGRPVAVRPRRARSPKYSYDALKVLQRVWAASGGQCAKYLVASMSLQLDGLERHGELVVGADRYSRSVRAELEAMSAATIDRYLKPAQATDQIKGVATTRPSPLLSASIKVRKAGDEEEAKTWVLRRLHRRALRTDAERGIRPHPEPDRRAHRVGVHPHHPQQRQHPHPGRAQTGRRRCPVRRHRVGLRQRLGVPQPVRDRLGRRPDIYFTRSRPYKKNDQATIESKNNHLVRKYGFY